MRDFLVSIFIFLFVVFAFWFGWSIGQEYGYYTRISSGNLDPLLFQVSFDTHTYKVTYAVGLKFRGEGQTKR